MPNLLSTAILALLAVARLAAADEVVIVTSFPKELFEAYNQAFEAEYPGVDVVVKSKSTSAAVAYVQETRRRPDADLVWMSATDAFAVLKAEGLLSSMTLPPEIAAAIPERLGPLPIHDPDGFFFGFALSGYGIMWNTRYLQAYGLPAPREWADLADQRYHGHLAMSAPSRSGTTHLLVESILQDRGWESGWDLLMAVAGNMAAVTERSFGVPQGINNGEFGLGLVIDFFALSAMASGYPVDFTYPTSTPIVPASIGLIAGGPNAEGARQFVIFLLAQRGQRLLFDASISRLPVIPELYAEAPDGYPNPFAMDAGGSSFDTALSESRYGLVNALFDQAITFRLGELRDGWKAVHEAWERIAAARTDGDDVSAATELLRQARRLVAAVPVTASQAADSAFAGQFSGESSAGQAALEAQWDNATRAAYERAADLAEEALERLP